MKCGSLLRRVVCEIWPRSERVFCVRSGRPRQTFHFTIIIFIKVNKTTEIKLGFCVRPLAQSREGKASDL